MITKFKTKGDNLTVGGFLMSIAGFILCSLQASELMPVIGVILNLIGGILFVMGCGYLASSRGYHWAWGALGIFSVVGYLIIVLCFRDATLSRPLQTCERPSGEGCAPTSDKQSAWIIIVSILLSVFIIARLIATFVPCPYPYQPVTEQVRTFISVLLVGFTLAMIAKRNLNGLLIAVVSQFLGFVLLFRSIAAVYFVVPALLLFVFPGARRRLKFNSHFNRSIWAVGLILVVVAGISTCFTCFNEKYIADRNPVWLFEPGDQPIHELDDSLSHVYDYWENGVQMGKCVVKYEKGLGCSFFALYIPNPFQIKEVRYFNEVADKIISEVNNRYGDSIRWSQSTDENGFPRYLGKVRNRIMIDVYCPDTDDTLCVFGVSLSK